MSADFGLEGSVPARPGGWGGCLAGNRDLEHGGRISSMKTPYTAQDELRLNGHIQILPTGKKQFYLAVSERFVCAQVGGRPGTR